MTAEIAVGISYMALKTYVRYKVIPERDMTNIDMMVERIIMTVCVELNVPRSSILSRSRSMPEKDARHIAIHLIRKNTGLSQKDIGKIFKRDRTTAIHSIEVIDEWMLYDKKFNALYTRLEKLI